MKKHEKIWERYKRNHSGSGFGEAEESKIKKESSMAGALDRKTAGLIKNALSDIVPAAEDKMEEAAELAYRAKKVRGNAKTHHSRRGELLKNKDFD